jgi:hypothetical protein
MIEINIKQHNYADNPEQSRPIFNADPRIWGMVLDGFQSLRG